MISQLEDYLVAVTGLDVCSMQPNSGAQGEYAGLYAIRRYHQSRGDAKRNVCLIPTSAHGTNPASAAISGMRVVVVKCDDRGNIDVEDLKAKATEHKDSLAAIMITYPSTHGVFEESVQEICEVVHSHGGQVYLDGANFNALMGHTNLRRIGADVCHLNLHKTFAIPHGGGGPGMGPICAREHLRDFLPGHIVRPIDGRSSFALSNAPFGSAGILPISYAYIRLLGEEGLLQSSEVSMLSANYLLESLKNEYKILYTGERGRCAHEFIIDLREFKKSAGVVEEDVAKRLMDYGFHAPTMSFPVAGGIMIEPTESESLQELDDFVTSLVGIRREI